MSVSPGDPVQLDPSSQEDGENDVSVRDWYYCRDCEVYGHGPECWCCGSTTPQRAELPRLDDKRLVSERMAAALDRARELAAANAPGDAASEIGEITPAVPIRYAS
jgi:hypothetical protein